MTRRFSHLGPTWPLVSLIVCLLAVAPTIVRGQGQTLNLTLTHAGYERSYILYVPSGYTAENNTPLVVNLHGAGANLAEVQMTNSGMNVVAEREGFLVAYPNAIGVGWWGGHGGTNPYDDFGFFDAMIDQISLDHTVDRSRVYATGISGGAGPLYALNVLRPYTYAAIAPVAAVRPYVPGTTAIWPADIPPVPSRPFPLLHIHGTADPYAPYYGGYSSAVGQTFPAVEQVVGEIAQNNGADSTPSIVDLPNINTTDSSTVQLLTYGNGDMYLDTEGHVRQAEVLLYRVVNGGHNWPGGGYPFPPVNRDINASEEIWNFFSRHTVAMRGDYNLDAVIDDLDYETWKAAFGSTVYPYAGADGNGNGVVDAADYTVWRDHMSSSVAGGVGAIASANSDAGVPEPAAIGLVVTATALLCARRAAAKKSC